MIPAALRAPLRVLAIAGFLAAGLALPAAALSLYDIVQLSKARYSDRQIIELIEKTESRFYVDADTLVALKKEGVSEPVVRAILKARTDEKPREERPAADDWRSSPAPRNDDRRDEPQSPKATREDQTRRDAPPVHDEPNGERVPDRAVAPPTPYPAAATRSEPVSFAALPFDESTAGHGHGGGHGHIHYAVGIAGVPVFIVRDEAGYASVEARAAAIAEVLNHVRSEEGVFAASDDIVSFRPAGGQPHRITAVTRGDVVAYQRHSVGSVTPPRLAAYWAALLNDFTRVMVAHEPPSQLGSLYAADSLQSIYGQLQASSQRAALTIPQIIDRLSDEERDHLSDLASRIPAEFDRNGRTH